MVLTIRNSTPVDSDCWYPITNNSSHGLNTPIRSSRQPYPVLRFIVIFTMLDRELWRLR
jgi:hypothetical protein